MCFSLLITRVTFPFSIMDTQQKRGRGARRKVHGGYRGFVGNRLEQQRVLRRGYLILVSVWPLSLLFTAQCPCICFPFFKSHRHHAPTSSVARVAKLFRHNQEYTVSSPLHALYSQFALEISGFIFIHLLVCSVLESPLLSMFYSRFEKSRSTRSVGCSLRAGHSCIFVRSRINIEKESSEKQPLRV